MIGDWDRSTGQGGGNTHLEVVLPIANGLLTTGYHEADDGTPLGEPLPVAGTVPNGGRATPTGETTLIARLLFNLNVIFEDSFELP